MSKVVKALRMLSVVSIGLIVLNLGLAAGLNQWQCLGLSLVTTILIMISNLIYYELGRRDEEL